MQNIHSTALLSVTDKSGLEMLARSLRKWQFEILATDSTAQFLSANQLTSTPLSEYLNFNEQFDGRVKTLHPKLYCGILHRGEVDAKALEEQGIKRISVLVVNLYQFQEIANSPQSHLQDAINHIDIGGVTLIRAGAKNFEHVAVLTDPRDYAAFCEVLDQNEGNIPKEYRFHLAKMAFAHTASYESAIANFFGSHQNLTTRTTFPETLTKQFIKKSDLRYGENPQQKAAFYIEEENLPGTLADYQQIQGNPCSYNNLLDADTAWECARNFLPNTACVIIKHSNPCGVSVAEDTLSAYQKAFDTDPQSAYGGIIAFNRKVNAATVAAVVDHQFAELMIAPDFEPEAIEILKKRGNLRVLRCDCQISKARDPELAFNRIGGGMLVQYRDTATITEGDLKFVSQIKPNAQQIKDLLFAWHVAKYVKSNAIVFAKDEMTMGIGAGQMSRVFSAEIAILKAQQSKLSLINSVMASDAFIPFPDTIHIAAQAGAKAIIQPGGSIRDAAIIQAADETGIALIFTGIRHFRH